MQLIFAEQKDIDTVTELRMEYMYDAYDTVEEEQLRMARLNNISYLKQELNGTCFIAFAEENGIAVSSVYMNIMQRAANLKLLDGRYAEIYGVYTTPEYRGQGLATELMKLAMVRAKELGLSVITLEASSMGKGLYERLGFIPDTYGYEMMEYTLPKQ